MAAKLPSGRSANKVSIKSGGARSAYQKSMPAGGMPHQKGSKGRSAYQSLASSAKGRAAHT